MKRRPIEIKTPLDDEVIARLAVGDSVCLSGVMYTARDAAHKRLVEMLSSGEALPFDFAGQVVYYARAGRARSFCRFHRFTYRYKDRRQAEAA